MGKKLYVGNLAYGVTDADLRRIFEAHGTVQSAQVIMDRDAGRSKGFGFVEMGSDAGGPGGHRRAGRQGAGRPRPHRQRGPAQDRRRPRRFRGRPRRLRRRRPRPLLIRTIPRRPRPPPGPFRGRRVFRAGSGEGRRPPTPRRDSPITRPKEAVCVRRKASTRGERELHTLLAAPAGRDELRDLSYRYSAAGGRVRPECASLVTYILVHEREGGLIVG